MAAAGLGLEGLGPTVDKLYDITAKTEETPDNQDF